jgi:hypothetical protein
MSPRRPLVAMELSGNKGPPRMRKLSERAGNHGSMGNTPTVRSPKQLPAPDSRRPPEPLRPLPARRAGISLLSAKARRRRYRSSESGGPSYSP